MRVDLIGLALVAVVIAVAVMFRPAPDNLLRFRVEGDRAYANGVTDGRSQGAVRKLIREHPDVSTLVFERMPGTQDVTSNYRLGRTIREAGLRTELTRNSRIASGAVDLFLAGTSRTIACGASIGVHAWGTSGFDAQDVRWDTHRNMSRDYIADMGVDPDFYDFRTQAAGSDNMHWMSVEEINRFALSETPIRCD